MGGMKLAGAALIGIGAILVLIAVMMETGVETGAAAYGGVIPAEVSNLGLMQKQMVTLLIGLAMFLGGCVFLAAGHVADRPPPATASDLVAAVPAEAPAEAREVPEDRFEGSPVGLHPVEESELEKKIFRIGVAVMIFVAIAILVAMGIGAGAG
jgi:hypothetical protein